MNDVIKHVSNEIVFRYNIRILCMYKDVSHFDLQNRKKKREKTK